MRRPEDALLALYCGELSSENLTTPYLEAAAVAFTDESPGVRQALLRLLTHLAKFPELLGTTSVMPHLGPLPGNTLMDAWWAIARRHRDWVGDVEGWKPADRGVRKQFGSLVRRLLAPYPVPSFMDAAWFGGSSDEADREQDWFIHIGAGRNIRTGQASTPLTSRAAHYFLQAPADLTITAAIRWGQTLGMGGDERLALARGRTRLRDFLEDEPFWVSVIQFFVNSPMLDPTCIGPMVDYIASRRFGMECSAPEPAFSMKGRTAAALWRRVEQWHRELARTQKHRVLEWFPSGIAAGNVSQTDPQTGEVVKWRVVEILTYRELQEEGRAMRHCVASYAKSCVGGKISIWSLQAEYAASGTWRRVMTIEVENRRRCITQARGRCNRRPGERRQSPRLETAPGVIREWARQAGLTGLGC